MKQNFEKLYLKLLFCAISGCVGICITSCAGGTGDAAETSVADSSLPDSVMPDSLVPDTTENKAPEHIRSKAEIDDFIANSPDKAKYEEGIIPTIAEYVPEYASKLLDNEYDSFLIVDKNTMKLYRYDKYGRELENVGIACARNYGTKHKKADSRTPEGFFTIEGIYNSTDWLFTDDNGYTSPAKGSFGPRFMRLRIPNTSQIGIHGTSSPGSIGGRRSHGCIRMTNENILRIHKLCTPGMPVIVSPGPKDMAVNEYENCYVPSVPVKKGVAPCVAGNLSAYERERLKNEGTQAPAPKDTVSGDSVAPATSAPQVEVPQTPSATESTQTSAPAQSDSAPAQ